MISVLTLVKNREAHLLHLVEGLARSTAAPDELIIVDMSERPIAKPVTAFPSTLLRLETEGLPLAQARNLAAAQVRSDRLLFLDVDCIPASGLLARMSRALAARDALICADVRYLAEGDLQVGWTEEALLRAGLPHPVRNFPSDGLRTEPNFGLFWSLAFGIRRVTFEAMNGFDERFTGYGAEDTDFGFRARDADIELLFLGGPGALHQHHGVIDPPLQHFGDILRNARIFHQQWGSWPMLGWLHAFAQMGLIVLTPNELIHLRDPGPNELSAAKQGPERRF